MNYRVVYLSNVQYDLQEAYDYYEKELPGPGEEFLEHVDKVIEYISDYPLHFQKIFDVTRKVTLVKFP